LPTDGPGAKDINSESSQMTDRKDSKATKPISLRRERIRILGVRAGLRTGICNGQSVVGNPGLGGGGAGGCETCASGVSEKSTACPRGGIN
jgi:hypothetical protein